MMVPNVPREELRKSLQDHFFHTADRLADDFCARVLPMLKAQEREDLTGYEAKAIQYKIISEEADPILLRHSPFYCETGTVGAQSDGAGRFHGFTHAGTWSRDRAEGKYHKLAPELAEARGAQGSELLYLICGCFQDDMQHFFFNPRPVLKNGLSGLAERAKEALKTADTEEKAFLSAMLEGLYAVKRIEEKFAAKAARMAEKETDEDEKARLLRIRDTAARVPWEAPKSFYEALETLAFLRTVVGALEGVGYNSFGRPDVDLWPFYEKDIEEGRLTEAEAEELICAFLLEWDCRYDHDMKMVGYADHELENTYTLGGCDAEGKPVYNTLTHLFLKVTREEKIIFPKIKARYSSDSPKEYLDDCTWDVVRGTSVLLYQNDEASIASLVRAGRTVEDARDYIITGCWGMMTYGNIRDDHGNYVNILKPFEFAIHRSFDKMKKVGLTFETFDDAEDFEELYARVVRNCRVLLKERNRMTLEGKPLWHKLNPMPLSSSVLDDCIGNKKDLSNGGCKYHDEHYQLVGFPNIIDSLLAIKTLCFDKKVVSLPALLEAVRNNWEGNEVLRQMAMHAPGWGDGSAEVCELGARFQNDLYALTGELETLWPGGKINLGHLTYTEIRFWAEKTLATPDGRRNGEYFSQGLTPSRLKKIPAVTSVVESLRALDMSTLGGNTVVNIILPAMQNGMTLETAEAFLYAAAKSSLGSLQLNCASREELLDAQIHPEDHKDLIVRVCGFSARFTALSPEWQAEVLSRNFYEG